MSAAQPHSHSRSPRGPRRDGLNQQQSLPSISVSLRSLSQRGRQTWLPGQNRYDLGEDDSKRIPPWSVRFRNALCRMLCPAAPSPSASGPGSDSPSASSTSSPLTLLGRWLSRCTDDIKIYPRGKRRSSFSSSGSLFTFSSSSLSSSSSHFMWQLITHRWSRREWPVLVFFSAASLVVICCGLMLLVSVVRERFVQTQQGLPILPDYTNSTCSVLATGLTTCASLNGRLLTSGHELSRIDEQVARGFSRWLGYWTTSPCRDQLLEVYCLLSARSLGYGPCDAPDDLPRVLPPDIEGDNTDEKSAKASSVSSLRVPAGRDLSEDPLGARIAFILMVSERGDTSSQIQRLVGRIAHPRHCLAVHASGSQQFRSKVSRILSQVHDDLISTQSDASWKYVVMPTQHTAWGHWSLVQIELDALRALLSMCEWDYAINLSGSHYPVETAVRIGQYLARMHSAQFPMNMMEADFAQRDEWIHDRLLDKGVVYQCVDFGINKEQRFYALPFQRALPAGGLNAFKGSQWHIMSRGFVEYVHRPQSARMQYWRRLFRFAWIPDEGFFQTILLNSPFNITFVNSASTFFVFPRGDYHPKVLDERDFVSIVRSKQLFVRKVDPVISKRLMDLLDHYADGRFHTIDDP